MKTLFGSSALASSGFCRPERGNGPLFVLLLALLVFTAGPVFAQSNILLNGSWENVNASLGWWGITSWTSTHQNGGTIISNAVQAQDGDNYNRLNAFGSSTHLLEQRWPCSSGKVYQTDAQMMTPAGADVFTPNNGYCAVMMQFYDASGTKVGGTAEAPRMRTGGPTDWALYKTAPAIAPDTAVTGRTLVLYVAVGDTTTNGYVYVDDVRSYESGPTTAGALNNPDFEVNPIACCDLQGIPYWEGLGNAGGVVANTNYTPDGAYTLAIWWEQNLVGQTWSATPGTRYATGANLLTPSGGDQLTTTGDTHGIVILEYYDSTGTNLLLSYLSDRFVAAATNRDKWVFLEAEGIAPPGTVYGKTLLGILGSNTVSGLIFFDDATQRVAAAGPTSCGEIGNPSFDDGIPGNAYDLDFTGFLPDWVWLGGTNAGFVQGTTKRTGAQAAAITYPDNLFVQTFEAETGMSYIVEGYIYNPSPTDTVLKGTAYGTFLLEFRDEADYFDGTNVVTNTISISTAETLHFDTNSANDTWIKFSVTNHAPHTSTHGGIITGRVDCAIFGNPSNFAGALYYDDICVIATNIPKSNSQAGALWNPGFEYSAKGTALTALDNWENFGFDGAVNQDHVRSGDNAVQIFYTETLAGQDWTPIPGYRYKSEGYAYTPSDNRLSGITNAALQAVIVQEFFNSTGGVIIAYASNALLTNSAPDTWHLLSAEGVAPTSAVSARTSFGIVGGDDGFAGAVWFDDMSQSVTATGPTTCGLLGNPGFDDGIPGNASELGGELLDWSWLGGTNAGYITGAVKKNGGQSAAITFPQNLFVQEFAAETSMSYTVSGYIQNPLVDKLAVTGEAYGAILVEFRDVDSTGTNVISVSATEAGQFTQADPTDTWIYYSVTARAPSHINSGSLTGRVLAAILGDSTNFSGALYFDELCLTATNVPFTNSTAGALANPGFEDTQAGTGIEYIDNWIPFGIAGTLQDTIVRSGDNALQIFFQGTLIAQDWPATPGDKYQTEAYVYTPSADPIAGSKGTNVEDVAGVVVLQFLNSTGGVEISYASDLFTTGAVQDVWTKLESIGVCPQNAVTGRTLVGLIGEATNFTGSLYIDDTSQSLVWSTPPVYSLIGNAGFDDGPFGNIDILTNSFDLPNWEWFGGTNAGFIQRAVVKNEEQAASITFPDNLLVQTFTATTGQAYVVEGHMQNPSDTNNLLKGEAYGVILLEFLDVGEFLVPTNTVDTNGVTNLAFNVETGTTTRSVAETVRFTTNDVTDSWVKFAVTNISPWTSTSGSIITGRVAAAIFGSNTGFAGAIYFDDFRVTATNITLPVNTQSGALWNPGFEYTAKGTTLPFVDNYEAFGFAGGVGQTYVRSGNNAVQMFFTETLAGQTWDCVGGNRYATEGYVFTPSVNRFSGNDLLQALVVLQFLDATNGILISYPSTPFTTGSVADVWTLLEASGVAPVDAVKGRTLIGVVGTNSGYAGEVWFDDLSQSLVSSGGTTCGIIDNPGFDDGILGNLWSIDPTSNTNVPPPSDDLPGWSYFGGNNAAFLAPDIKKDGYQSLVLTYPLNFVAQDFQATGPELLLNGDFEDGPAGGAAPDSWWTANAVGQESWGYETGTNGMVFYSWTDLNWGFFGQDVAVDSSLGDVFQFSIRGLAESNFSSWSAEAYMKIEMWKDGEASARIVYTNDIYPQLTFVADTWSDYVMTVTNSDSEIDKLKVVVGYGQAEDIGGDQAAKFDNASLLQGPSTSGYTYVASGYLYTPSGTKFTTDGTSWGEISLLYFADGSNLVSEFTATSMPFTASMAADTWHYFAVTSTIPLADDLTGRLNLGINSLDPGTDFELGGVIYFDEICLTMTDAPTGSVTAFQQWQLDNFGSTGGANTGPTEDYDGDLFDNWSEYIAGTEATNINSFLEALETPEIVNGGIVIQWDSTAGRYYGISRASDLSAGPASFVGIISNLVATPPMNIYTDIPPTIAETYYYKIQVSTNSL